MLYLFLKTIDREKYPVLFGLVAGGGVSNILDRTVFGGVRDWFTVPMLGLRNNIADWAIMAGLVWYGIILMHDYLSRNSNPVRR